MSSYFSISQRFCIIILLFYLQIVFLKSFLPYVLIFLSTKWLKKIDEMMLKNFQKVKVNTKPLWI